MTDLPDASSPAAPSPDGTGTAADDGVRTTPLPAGSCLIAIAFADPLYAQEALLAALRLKTRKRLGVEDAAIVSKAAGGKIRIQQTKDLGTADGAMSGGWLGLLAGLVVGGPLVGGALGAAMGGLWAKLRDIGISDPEMKHLGESLRDDEAALFLLLDGGHRWHAMNEARRFPGRILHTTLSPADEHDLAQALGAGVTTL